MSNIVIGSIYIIQCLIYLILAIVYHVTDSLTLITIPIHIIVPTDGPTLENTTYEIIESFEVSPLWLVVVYLFISGLFHFIRSNICASHKVAIIKSEDKHVKDRTWRWFDHTLTSTLMMLTIILLAGVTNFYAIIGIVSANLSMVLFQYMGDMMDAQYSRSKALFYSAMAGVVPWVIIFVQFGIMGSQGNAPSALVLATVLLMFFMFLFFFLNEMRYMMTFGKPKTETVEASRDAVEWWYNVLFMTTKTVLGILTAVAVLQ